MSSQVTGHLRVEDRKTGPRVWVATITRHDGSKTRPTLGPAWVKDTGRRKPRGGVIWRAADGPCPDGYLPPKAAEVALAGLLAAERAKPGGRSRVAGRTFGEAAASYLSHAETVGGSRGAAKPTTMRGYRSIAKTLAAEFPDATPLRRVTAPKLTAYQERLLTEGNISRATVRHRMLVLRAILAHAVERGWLSRSPADDLKIIPQPQAGADFNVLEPSQVEAVARAVSTVTADEVPFYRAAPGEVDTYGLATMTERRALYSELVRIAAYTGLRFGELRALRWRDVNFGGTVHVVRNAPASAPSGSRVKAPKSGKGRSVPLGDDAAAAFDRVSRHLSAHGLKAGAEDLVFQTREGGMLDDGRVRDAFYAGLDAVGLGHLREKDNPMTFHDLRHVFGTIAVRVFPLTDVQAYMGHANIQTTMRYVHHTPRPDAAAKLTAAFAEDRVPMGIPAPKGEGATA